MDFLCTLIKYTLIISTCTFFLRGEVANYNSDKLVLNPVQLIDLVMKEKFKNNGTARYWRHFAKKSKYSNTSQMTTELSELSDDETRLKRRKVWSRWGKWSECSVTCGGGIMLRSRQCVAGRCAPGEHEEQSRPCARAPCSQTPPLADDTHDLE